MLQAPHPDRARGARGRHRVRVPLPGVGRLALRHRLHPGRRRRVDRFVSPQRAPRPALVPCGGGGSRRGRGGGDRARGARPHHAAARGQPPGRALGVPRRQAAGRRRRRRRRWSGRSARSSDAAVSVGELLDDVEWRYPEKTVRLRFFRCALEGEPRAAEGQEIAWVAPADLGALRVPARRRRPRRPAQPPLTASASRRRRALSSRHAPRRRPAPPPAASPCAPPAARPPRRHSQRSQPETGPSRWPTTQDASAIAETAAKRRHQDDLRSSSP